ncbi:MAG: 50S ribosomal protein L3 [Myxococcales bacterium]|nr:50S ribosomal protein L3 [Myxococcales bacterium]
MSLAILGTKLGMAQVFDENGYRVPVTVIAAGPCVVLQKKSADGRDGYDALKIGFGDVKPQRLTKPERGVFKKLDLSPKRVVREIRVSADELSRFEVGAELKADIFAAGDMIDVIGTSKGHGFTGPMKRHGFHGGSASHGTHEYFRHGGSIGTSAYPSRVFKGKKMAGQHGNSKVTVQNLKIFSVDAERNEIWVRGAVPGPNNRLVVIRSAVKKPKKG